MNKIITTLVIGILFGLGIAYFSQSYWINTKATERQPLYWVAPMDANYQRDKPGQSPMGMDLVPFYADEGGSNDETGTIRVSPDVINNLGVKTAKAKMRSLQNEIKTVGIVQYNQDQLVHIHPRVEGWIEKLYVKTTGEKVEKGQILYEIYSPALVNAQEELVLALSRNNKGLIAASKDRLKSLQIPAAAIKNLVKSRKVQQNIAFYAPQSGYVENLNIRQGHFVKPMNLIMSIVKLDQVWVETEVFERDIALVELNQNTSMTVMAFPKKSWQGKVDYIYPKLDAKTRTLRVRLRFENLDHLLKPNMYAQVLLHAQNMEQYLLVPRAAVIRSGKGDRVVLVMGEGKFKSIGVKIGRSDDEYIEIVSGLDIGDEIVISAQFLLDSESSKISDFKRMNHEDFNQPPTATTTGVINSLMIEHGMLTIDREAIEEWNRPAATVDFIIAENIDISELNPGDKIFFTFIIKDGDFVITEFEKLSQL